MSLSLSDMKKSKQSRLDNLVTKANTLNNGNGGGEREKDARFWQPTVDQAGNGAAVIRFLPASKTDGLEALPWVTYFSHRFKGPSGKWYIEKSLTTIGQTDPVSEYNSKLWKTGDEDLKKQVRNQKRKQSFVSNILVINDPAHPENNGKVFLFRYGKKIFEKIKNIMTPDADLGEEQNDPFDFWTGQNFKLKVKKVSDFPNYDDSAFASATVIAKKDEDIEAIWENQFSLSEFTDPANYGTYADLREKLYKVLEIRDESIAKSAERLSMQVEDSIRNSADEAPFDVSDGEDADLDAILNGLK